MTGDLVCKTLKTQAAFCRALIAMVLMWGCQDISLETITPSDLSLDTEYWLRFFFYIFDRFTDLA